MNKSVSRTDVWIHQYEYVGQAYWCMNTSRSIHRSRVLMYEYVNMITSVRRTDMWVHQIRIQRSGVLRYEGKKRQSEYDDQAFNVWTHRSRIHRSGVLMHEHIYMNTVIKNTSNKSIIYLDRAYWCLHFTCYACCAWSQHAVYYFFGTCCTPWRYRLFLATVSIVRYRLFLATVSSDCF